MNQLSALAAETIIGLPKYNRRHVNPNPEFGPVKYKSDGDTYKGQYHQGFRDGFGELTTVDGAGYIGE